MRIQKRISKLEPRLKDQLRPKKSCIPDWLHTDLESEGWIFDISGHLISAPDPLRSPRLDGQPVDDEESARWLQIPEFEAAYRKARRAGFAQCVARLQQASSAAVSTLLKFMVDPNTPAASRVRAAGCVLEHATKAIEVEDLEVRVTQLEQAGDVSKPGWGK